MSALLCPRHRPGLPYSTGIAVTDDTLTLDVPMAAGRRAAPGCPLPYATTPAFLRDFGLLSRCDLPGVDDLRAAGLLDPVDSAGAQWAVEKDGDGA